MKISWVNTKLAAQKSSISKKGVFALKPIKQGERVAVFGGYVVSIKELPQIKKEKGSQYDTILDIGYQIDDDLIFSPTAKNQFSVIEYLNHSCEPSCGFSSETHLVALRDIKQGEEITMDYAMCITSNIFSMTCLCGKDTCRKKVTGDDWKRPGLQKKYKGHFQPYIERKIKALI